MPTAKDNTQNNALILQEKLADIQARLNAPKNQYNSFGEYNYRSCEDILSALKPLLAEHQLSVTISDEVDLIGERYYIRATATITDGNDSISSVAYAREPATKKKMDEAQITGATSSYARKYALNGLFAIDDTKDADSTNNHTEKKDGLPAGQTITTEQRQLIEDLVVKTNSDPDKFLDWIGVKTFEEIPARSFRRAKAALEAKMK